MADSGLRRLWVVFMVALLAHVVVGLICAISPEGHVSDFARFRELATTPGRPYVDYAAEYPPGALAVFVAAAHATPSAESFNAILLFMNAVADVAIIAALTSVWGLEAGAFFAVASIPILSLLYFRMDLWSAATTTWAVAFWARGRHWTSLSVLGAGAALKLWPLALAGLLFGRVDRLRSAWPRALWLLGLTIAAGIAWYWFDGLKGLGQVMTFRGATGWHIESTLGSVWRAAQPATMRFEAGASRVGWHPPWLSPTMYLLSAPLALWAMWRGDQTGRLGTGWVAAIGTVLSCSALLSPQFLGWLLPGAAIAWAEGDRRTARLVALLVVVTVAYRVLHTQQMPALVIARNLLLIVTTVTALVQLRAQTSQDRLVVRFEPEVSPDR